MARALRLLARYRFLAAALAASLALHAAVFVSLPARLDWIESPPDPPFVAELLPPPPAPLPPPEVKRPAAPKPVVHKAAPKPRPMRHRAAKTPPPPAVPQLLTAASPEPSLPPVPPPAPEVPPELPPPPPAPVAIAEPIIPWMPRIPQHAPEPELFPMEGLPAHLSIEYQLTSGPLRAHATYQWERDGDSYRIIGEGRAVGLFRIFEDRKIVQESEGTITTAGLRPERFVEKGAGDHEGIEFDWLKHEVTLEHGESRKTAPLGADTVDWLTMIFQLAHTPPRAAGEKLDLHVYTQRRLYDFGLKVLGVEEIEIPLGTVRALHLRHTDAQDGEETDVWLGVDQHYLPVKMRYPVGKINLMVEQSAARITER
jgi:hypothetical protein